ncbi:MAG TPA: hypothetical protein VGN64_04460, partial [Dyadobacter sp.]|nr:hypothetical protein [Dyadobacter sp.]
MLQQLLWVKFMLAAPYKEQLHSHGAFSEQVIAVLAGLGYRLVANKSDFVFLRIYKSDCKALTVALIDHDSWLLPNASLRYQIVYQHVSKL